jgi:hypothetical protein
MGPTGAPHATLAKRAQHELMQYLGISAYLYVSFGALIFYKASILRGQGVEYAPYGLALAKALILGKFMLMAHALKFGERTGPNRLVLAIVWKSILFALLLVLLAVIEELIVGFFHGHAPQEVLNEIAGGTLLQFLATSLLVLMIMIPYFAFRELSASLGEGQLIKLLTERRAPPAPIGDRTLK